MQYLSLYCIQDRLSPSMKISYLKISPLWYRLSPFFDLSSLRRHRLSPSLELSPLQMHRVSPSLELSPLQRHRISPSLELSPLQYQLCVSFELSPLQLAQLSLLALPMLRLSLGLSQLRLSIVGLHATDIPVAFTCKRLQQRFHMLYLCESPLHFRRHISYTFLPSILCLIRLLLE